tara:strand:+ start:715 stop:1740 length:1026 start_codon:yes stop_codon:yes gene_type:complete
MKYEELINQETLKSLPQEEQDNYNKVTQRMRADLVLDLSPEYVNKPFYFHKSFIIKNGKIQKRRLSIKEQAQQDFEQTGSFSYCSMSQAMAYAWNEIVIERNGKYKVPSNGIPRYNNRLKREVFNMGKLAKIKGQNLVPYPLALAGVMNNACDKDRMEGSETIQRGKRTFFIVNKYCAAQYLDDFLLVCAEWDKDNFPILRRGRSKWKVNGKTYNPVDLFTKEQRNQVQEKDKDGQIKIRDEKKLANEKSLEDSTTEPEVVKPQIVEPQTADLYPEHGPLVADLKRQLDELRTEVSQAKNTRTEPTLGGVLRKTIRNTRNMLAMPFGAMERMIKAKDETEK